MFTVRLMRCVVPLDPQITSFIYPRVLLLSYVCIFVSLSLFFTSSFIFSSFIFAVVPSNLVNGFLFHYFSLYLSFFVGLSFPVPVDFFCSVDLFLCFLFSSLNSYVTILNSNVCVCVLERASTRQCPRLAYIIDSVEILSDYLFVWQWEQHQTCVFLKMLPCTLSLSLFWLLIVVDGLLAAIFRLMNFVCGCREKNRNYCTVCMAAWNCLVLCIANGNRFANNYFHFSFWLLLFSLAVLRAHIFFGYFSVFVVVAVVFLVLSNQLTCVHMLKTPYSAKMGIRYEQKQFMSKNNVCRFSFFFLSIPPSLSVLSSLFLLRLVAKCIPNFCVLVSSRLFPPRYFTVAARASAEVKAGIW